MSGIVALLHNQTVFHMDKFLSIVISGKIVLFTYFKARIR